MGTFICNDSFDFFDQGSKHPLVWFDLAWCLPIISEKYDSENSDITVLGWTNFRARIPAFQIRCDQILCVVQRFISQSNTKIRKLYQSRDENGDEIYFRHLGFIFQNFLQFLSEFFYEISLWSVKPICLLIFSIHFKYLHRIISFRVTHLFNQSPSSIEPTHFGVQTSWNNIFWTNQFILHFKTVIPTKRLSLKGGALGA